MSVEVDMKVDGRTLDHKTLEQIRRMAFQRVREGEKPAKVIASFGFCRTTIYKWMNASAGRGRGLKALRSTRGTGRPRSLAPAQERQVFRWINGRNPLQYGLDFGLWTRQIVSILIKQKFGVRMGVTAVGRLLAKMGLTPQKPLQRAYQRDPQAIERWQRESFPAIVSKAKRQGARYTARLGAYAARRRWCGAPVNANRSLQPRRSMRGGAFGFKRTRVRSVASCLSNCSSE